MKVNLVRIGNSRGLRIPKTIIEECGLGNAVELHVKRGQIVITPERKPREGWAKAFKSAGPSDSDELLLEGAPNAFDRNEGKW